MKIPVLLLTNLIDEMPPADALLIAGTLQALFEADLTELLYELESRVVGWTPDTPEGAARDARLVDEHGQLRDFARLCLLDVRWAATVKGWTPRMRATRALEAMTLAGF